LTYTTSPALTATQYDSASNSVVLTSLVAINPNQRSLTIGLTVTAKNGAGTSDTISLSIQLYQCNLPNPAYAHLNFNFLVGVETTKSLTFTRNTLLFASCPQHTFSIDGAQLSTVTWLALLSNVWTSGTETGPNGELKITYDATMSVKEGAYQGQRKMRDQVETFTILVCQLEDPAPVLSGPTPLLFNIPSSGSATQTLTVNNFVMKPTDRGSSSAACATFSTSLSLSSGHALTSWAELGT